MSGPRAEPEAPQAGSELSTLRRLKLYIRRPADAFTITSPTERRRDARLVFVLYFLVKLPVAAQRSVSQGRLDKLDPVSVVAAVALALVLGVVLSLLLLSLAGLALHVVVNVILRADRSRSEALWLPTLCLAPTLILVLEFPSLLLDFRAESTFLTFLILRIAALVLSARMFYWGLVKLFDLRPRAALAVTLLPMAALVLFTLPLILAPGR